MNMNLIRRFSLVCAAALLILGAALGVLITRIYEANEIGNVRQHLAQTLVISARKALTPEDFAAPATRSSYSLIQGKISDILDIPGLMMVVLYRPDGTIVWATCPDVLGKRYPDDARIRAALRGTREAWIVRPDEAFHPCLSTATEKLELDVPVTLLPGESPAGVIQVFLNLDPLYESIRRAEFVVWGTLVLGFGALYLVLFGVVRHGHRLLDLSRRHLLESQEKLREKNLELLNRIGASALRETDVKAVLEETANDLCGLLSVPRCAIRSFGEPDQVVERCRPGFPSTASLFPAWPRPFDAEEIRRTGEPLLVSDVHSQESLSGLGEELRRLRIGAYLGVPLMSSDNFLGVLFIDSEEPHAWTREEVATVEVAARQIAMVLQHARDFQRMRDLSSRLVSLMNNVPGAVYRGLPDWTMPLVGVDMERITGHPTEEFTVRKRPWHTCLHGDDLPSMRERVRTAVRTRERILRLEYRIVRPDGAIRWISDRRQMFYDETGRFVYVDGLCLDITDRKKSEERLRLTQFSVDRSGDAAYWMARDGRFLYVNDKACDILGYGRDELLSMTIHEVNPDFPPDMWPAHWERLRREKSFTMESRHRAKDGRLIPVEITANHIEFDGQEYNCASARDISERMRAQEESRKLEEQVLHLQKMEALGILAGGVAHDFNNLLTGILGYANLLRLRSPDGSEQARAAAVIQASAERASQLTAQLLGFARKGKHQVVPVDVGKILGEVAALLERTLDKNIRIRCCVSSGRIFVTGDPTQIHQVVINLAMNAAQAMPDGGDLTLDCRAFQEKGHAGTFSLPPGWYAEIEVTDTGVGIPKEIIGKIFDPFFTTKEQGKGTGLGLSMVYGIVKNHGGDIAVESSHGQGTRFRAFFPMRERAVPEASERCAPPKARSADGANGKGHVLVIDDQEPVREVCTAMLETMGYEVLTAADGREGIEIFRRHSTAIDLVIVDMVMPNLGGRECFREIRRIRPDVKAVLSSGYTVEGAVQSVLEEGMLDFIQKPYKMEDLERVVNRVLGEGIMATGR